MRTGFSAVLTFGAILLVSSPVSATDKLTFFGLDQNGQPLEVQWEDQLANDEQVVFHAHEPPAGAVADQPAWLAPVRREAVGHHGDIALHRPELAELRDEPLDVRVRELVRILAQGPTPDEVAESHVDPIFPEGTRIESVTLTDAKVVEIRAEFSPQYLEDLRSGQQALDAFTHLLSDNIFILPVSGYMVYALDPESGEYAPLDVFEPEPDWESGPGEPDWATPPETWYPEDTTRARSQYPHPTGGRPTGSLTNRTVYMNAGHGWTWRSWNVWGVQRSFVFNNIEDMSNADLVHGWVQAYLHRAGADTFHVREMDPNPNMVIVDNDDGSPDYVETGTWITSSLAGFANGHIPYVQPQNPFSFGTNRLAQCVVGEPTATATWTPTIPESGFYNVYVSHAAFTNRSPQAHYRITHAGGESDYYIDQRRHRFTWIFIGRYFFEEGRDPDMGKVVLSNSSTSASHFVSADAVRFGGGRGVISRGTVGPSPYANHDNEAVYHLQFMGAPSSVYQSLADPPNDESKGWSGRPQFGRWLEGQSVAYGSPYYPAVFLSNHTNATAAGTARGTISYLHSNISGSNTIHHRFRSAVHNKVVHNLTNGYGGNYVVNSNPLRSGSFGEANPNNINGGTPNSVPIFLGEWLFHDNAQDMALYHDPKFRRIMARGIYQGIVDYFASEVGGPTTYLPEPPRNFTIRTVSPTTALLQWQAPESDLTQGHGHPATGYMIYRSTHGRGFAMGDAVSTSTVPVQNLTPGQTYYFQVTATNAGGESFPTETLAVKMPQTGEEPKVLIVNGYDKLDIATRVRTPHGSGILYRQFLDQMNTQDYIVEHARAIEQSQTAISFDSAEHDVVEAGMISLANYDAVIWIGGLQAEVSTADPIDDTALKSGSRAALTAYMEDGGKLFMSGAEIGWDLNRLNQNTFMNNTLRMSWDSEGPQQQVSGAPGSIFEGIDGVGFGGSGAPYPVLFPDVINTMNGSEPAMFYGDLSGTVLIDGFETIGQWRQPSFSGQTNADPSSSFSIAGSPVRTGNGSGNLAYVWGSGDFIRLYNQGLPAFPAASDFSIWVYGDSSGHRVRICLRDSDNDLFVTDWLTINFTGWQEIVWQDIANNPQNVWVQSGNGTVDGPNVRFDSIQVQKVSGQNSGSLYFDDATYAPTQTGGGGGSVAAIEFDGDSQLVYMGFPFETINDEAKRAQVMDRVLEFFFVSEGGVVVPPPPSERDRMMVY